MHTVITLLEAQGFESRNQPDLFIITAMLEQHLVMRTELFFSRHHEIGEVSPMIYGGFIEHMGRCIYGGIFDPDNPVSDAHGLRTDVLQALADLQLTNVRYPGGNFVSGYHWMDGVGPQTSRPTVQELAWKSIEPNQFGTDEFINLCHKLNWQPMLAVNLGT